MIICVVIYRHGRPERFLDLEVCFEKQIDPVAFCDQIYFCQPCFAGSENIRREVLTVEKCIVQPSSLGSFAPYKYTVIFARYENQWLYCRHKNRDVFETAGGRIEAGETPIEAAKRELFEETGALEFDIVPMFDYSVSFPGSSSSGQVFLADVKRLGDMPDFEMAEVRLFDTIPEAMRFPMILPVLFGYLLEMISYD